MSSSDRRPYLTATVLDQDFLDACRDNLESNLQMIVEIPTAEGFAREVTVTDISIASPGVITAADHRFTNNQAIKFFDLPSTSPTYPPEIVAGTTYYLSQIDHNTFSVSATSGPGSLINTTGSFSGPVGVQAVFPVIRASDRNIFVGSRFYEALTQFPVITRTLGEWLSPVIEFSSIRLNLSNVDGRFNDILPAGAEYEGWIGRQITVKLGLRDVESTYTTLFNGRVTPVGGFKRNIRSIDVTARDRFDDLSVDFPRVALTKTSFSNLADDNVGLIVPYILGDWTTSVDPQGNVPAYVVNGADPDMNGDSSNTNNVQLIIAENDLSTFQTSEVYVKKGDTNWPIDSADIVTTGAYPTSGSTNARFEIIQNGTTVIDGGAFLFDSGDEYLVKVKGTTLGGGTYDDNIIEQAKQILDDFTNLDLSTELDANVNTYRDKASPSQSAISTIKSRVWTQTVQPVMTYVLSMMEQVRLEMFISRDQKLKINTLHFEDWDDSPTFRVREHDVGSNTIKLSVDERNNFNRAQGFYNKHPITGSNVLQTSIYRNSAAITQLDDKDISNQIEFPNLYIEADVINQLTEILRLGSAYTELIDLDLTWRAALLDLGDFVKINITIGSTEFADVPMMIREFGVDPDGIRIPVKLWSFQLFPFKTYSSGSGGIVSSDTATITEET